MDHLKINMAIQLLPTLCSSNKIELIDKAIECIHDSGLKYIVCPFETVVEGTFDEIIKLVDTIRKNTLKNGCEELIINMKMHAGSKDLFFEDKILKYN